jgi:phenylalanyl-tRNA synthetase alpha chain
MWFVAAERRARLEAERLDLTEVVPHLRRGHLHLVTQTLDELEDIFIGMGFTVAEGPVVETDWYNFEALNFPAGHPARNMYDTLYVDLGEPESTLLRTHTSPVQIRVMEHREPPIYSIMPGLTHRRDTTDASHLPNFHQIEGLVVDRGITFGDLAGTLEAFTKAYFGGDIQSRLRPSYFPFTEPSAEYDVTCVFCKGAGCRTCSKTGWLELGGCGMVHPNVLANVGIDAEEWSGFAFGFGPERMALMKHGINDIRELVTNDIRFLEQF